MKILAKNGVKFAKQKGIKLSNCAPQTPPISRGGYKISRKNPRRSPGECTPTKGPSPGAPEGVEVPSVVPNRPPKERGAGGYHRCSKWTRVFFTHLWKISLSSRPHTAQRGEAKPRRNGGQGVMDWQSLGRLVGVLGIMLKF